MTFPQMSFGQIIHRQNYSQKESNGYQHSGQNVSLIHGQDLLDHVNFEISDLIACEINRVMKNGGCGFSYFAYFAGKLMP